MAQDGTHSIHDLTNVHGVAWSRFALDNMGPIADGLNKKPAADGADPLANFRSLYEEVAKTGPVDHEKSILSPACYLTDLLRLVRQKAVTGNGQPLPPESPLNLFVRRPDLLTIPLDAQNTRAEEPLLDTVNTALLGQIAALRAAQAPGTDETTSPAAMAIAEAPYPITQSYHAPLEGIRAHLGHMGTDLARVFDLFDAPEVAQISETLGLSAQEYALIIDPDVSQKAVQTLFDVSSEDEAQALYAFRNFLPKIALTPEQLSVLANEGRPREHIYENGPLKSPLFLNNALRAAIHANNVDPAFNGQTQYLLTTKADRWVIEEFYDSFFDSPSGAGGEAIREDHAVWESYEIGNGGNLGLKSSAYLTLCRNAALCLMNRFVRLSRALGWTFADLGWSLSQCGADKLDAEALKKLAQVKALKTRLDLPLDQVVCFRGLIHTSTTNADTPSLFQRIFGFEWRDEATEENIAARHFHIFQNAVPTWLATGFRLGAVEMGQLLDFVRRHNLLPVNKVTFTVDAKEETDEQAITLSFQNVCTLYRYALLAQILKRSLPETLTLLDLLGKTAIGLDDFDIILEHSAWLREANVSVAAAQALVRIAPTPDEVQQVSKATIANVVKALQQATQHKDLVHEASQDKGITRKQEIVVEALASQFQVGFPLLWSSLNHSVGVTQNAPAIGEVLNALAAASLDDEQKIAGLDTALVNCLAELALTLQAMLTFHLTEIDIVFAGKADEVIGTSYKSGKGFREFMNLRAMDEFRKIREAYPDIYEYLVDMVYEAGSSEDISTGGPIARDKATEVGVQLNALHGWNVAQVMRVVLKDRSTPSLAPDGPLYLTNAVAILNRIIARHELVASIGCDMALFFQMVDVAGAPVAPLDAAAWAKWEKLAADTRFALKSHVLPHEWSKLDLKIGGKLGERQRDALTCYALWLFSKPSVPASLAPFGPVTTLDDLSNILLIDVQMSGTLKISRVKQGLNTLQRYIQRCHMGLEKNTDVHVHIPLGDAEWSWRMHYRLWEANRKIFVFPENYLEPGARQHKTPLFTELEQELLQGAITEDSVAQAYLSYFEKLEVLANLDIVSSCQAMVENPGGSETQETVFLIGRSKSEPRTFFQCSAIVGASGDIERWKPWQKISLPLHVDHVICTWANARLHLFWVEQTTATDRGPDGRRNMRSHATVRFSHETVSGRWTPPQVLPEMDKVLVGSGYEVVAPEKVKQKTKPKPQMISDCFFTSRALQFPPGKPVVNLVLSVSPGQEPAVPIARIDLNGKPTGSFKPDRSGQGNAFALNSAIQPWTAAKAQSSNYMDNFTLAERLPVRSGGAAIENPGDLRVAPDGRTLILGTGLKGPYRSEDGGQTWTRITGPGGTRLLRFIGPLGNKMLFQGLHHLYSSANNGRTMQIEQDAWPKTGHQIASSLDGRVYLNTQSEPDFTKASIWRHEHGLMDWEPATQLFQNNTLISRGTSISTDGRTLFALYAGGVLKRSEDQGTTWRTCEDTLTGWFMQSVFHCRNGMVIAAGYTPADDPNQRTLVQCVFCSDDNGQTWTQYNFGPQRAPGVPSFAENSDGVVFMCYPDGHTYLSKSFGLDWTKIEAEWSTKADVITIGPDGLTMYLHAQNYYGHERAAYYAVIRPKTRNAIAHEWDYVTHSALPYLWHRDGARHHYDLSSVAVHVLRQKLSEEGLDAMLSLATQRTTAERRLNGVERTIEFGPHSMFAAYFREIFLHIPWIIANTLNAHQQHEEAQKWYHYIFRPLSTDTMIGVQGSDTGYWRFKPFADYTPESFTVNLQSHQQELALFATDPFDPWVISDLRLGAYEKALAMKYIDNLLDWGDRLFAEFTWESIVQAMVLYKRAQDLLGPRKSDNRAAFEPLRILTADEFLTRFQNEVDLKDPFHKADCAYFPLPRNDVFHGYWDRAEDRLSKIRQGLNIDGAHQSLALFQPPIDISALLQAKGAGQGSVSAPQSGLGKVPPYRFNTALRLAKEVTGTVIQFGSAFLSALEAKDAQKLNALRVVQERATLDMMTQALEKEVDLAQASLSGLRDGKKAAAKRVETFSKRIDDGVSATEHTAINLRVGTLLASTLAMVYNEASVPVHLLPTVFGLADGCFQPGTAIQAHATGMSELSGLIEQGIQMTSERAAHERREEEWKIQLSLSKAELTQAAHQVTSAEIQVEIAKANLAQHTKAIAQAQEVSDLLEARFGDEALFQWLTGQLASVYFQCFQLALSWARAAERAYEFECNAPQKSRIRSFWSDLQRGLMAGENLMLGLMQLEKAFHDDRPDALHIEKTVSLKAKDPAFIEEARNDNYTFSFDLTEDDFARDFPGHYNRRIESIAVTIPAVVGPYQNIHATLTQTCHRLVPSVDAAGQAVARALLSGSAGDDVAMFNAGSVPRTVAISRGVSDTGTFDMEFHNDAYRPFERTGAVSSWTLALPEFSNKDVIGSLSDILIHIRYSALDGGADHATEVLKQLREKDAGH